jgi:hypothetical protein
MKKYSQLIKGLPSKTVIMTVGSFNPPTSVNEMALKLVHKLVESHSADHIIYVTEDKDSLPVDRKLHFLELMFGSMNFKALNESNMASELASLKKRYKDVIVVASEDKAKLYESMNVVTTGNDVDHSKIKTMVTKGDFASFKKQLPSMVRELDARRIMNEMRQVQGLELIKEDIKFSVDALREKYFKGEIYHVGDIVESAGQEYEIMDRGSNYLVVVNSTGDLSRKWIKDVTMVESKKLDKACWKGYKAIGLKKKNGKSVPNCVPEQVQVNEQHTLIQHNDDHKVISHGPDFSFKIHKDHHDKIKALDHMGQYDFKCMDGIDHSARKVGDKLHFQRHPGETGIHGNMTIHIPHSEFMGDDDKQVNYKGYTSKNLHNHLDMVKSFKLAAVDAKDPVAMLNAIKTTDAYIDLHNKLGDNPDIHQIQNWKYAHIKSKESLQKIGVYDAHAEFFKNAESVIGKIDDPYNNQLARTVMSYQDFMKAGKIPEPENTEKYVGEPHTNPGHMLATRHHLRRQKIKYVHESWSDTGKTGKHDASGEESREQQKVDKEGKATGERRWMTKSGKPIAEGEVEGEKITSIKPLPPELSPTADEPGRQRDKSSSAFFEKKDKKVKKENLDYLDLDSWLRQQSPQAHG